jgi:DmsE family decaheme c-type cytochrome
MRAARSRGRRLGLLCVGLLLALFTLANTAFARDIDRCTRCHDETEEYPVLSILQTKHATQEDPRIPLGTDGCETCHGIADDHLRAPAEGERRTPPPVTYGPGAPTPPKRQNTTCLQCHESGERMHWRGSQHEFQDVTCVSCHAIHHPRDPALDKRRQTDVCANCHVEKRAEIRMPFAHPLVDGQMSCADCHNPHGSPGPQLLREPTLVETCHTCHAEVRGPFLWEHPPVREDCSTCHQPHGSIHPRLLHTRGPWLCQQCHLGTHSSDLFDRTTLPTGERFDQLGHRVLGQNCLNCHSKVHGSNHPAGGFLTR